MANLEYCKRHLLIFVFSYSYGDYLQSDIFEILQGNSHFTPLRSKKWRISKILSHISTLFIARVMVFIIKATFGRCYG